MNESSLHIAVLKIIDMYIEIGLRSIEKQYIKDRVEQSDRKSM